MPRQVGIIMNEVTGRMGTRQNLVRSVAAIRIDVPELAQRTLK